jgi:hypothetical protein
MRQQELFLVKLKEDKKEMKAKLCQMEQELQNQKDRLNEAER